MCTAVKGVGIASRLDARSACPAGWAGIMMIGSPGFPFQSILSSAPLAYVRRLLGDHACELLELLHEGGETEEVLRRVAASAVSAERLIGDADERALLLGLLPETKQVELADRLG